MAILPEAWRVSRVFITGIINHLFPTILSARWFLELKKKISNSINNQKMDIPSVEIIPVIVVTLIVIGLPHHSAAATLWNCWPNDLVVDNTAIERGFIAENGSLLGGAFCKKGAQACHAAQDLACAFHAQSQRDTPNTMGRGGPESYEIDVKTYKQTIWNLGRIHPERRPLYCRLLTRIASLDRGDGPEGETRTENWTIELAAHITTSRFDCIDMVMRAFPDNPAAHAGILAAREHCEIEKGPFCRRIIYPHMILFIPISPTDKYAAKLAIKLLLDPYLLNLDLPDYFGKLADDIFAPPLAKLIKSSSNINNIYIATKIKDSICACHGSKLQSVAISVVSFRENSAIVVAQINKFESTATISYRIVNDNFAWKISDISESGMPSLRTFLEDGLRRFPPLPAGTSH